MGKKREREGREGGGGGEGKIIITLTITLETLIQGNPQDPLWLENCFVNTARNVGRLFTVFYKSTIPIKMKNVKGK